jgi:hypothetical protein
MFSTPVAYLLFEDAKLKEARREKGCLGAGSVGFLEGRQARNAPVRICERVSSQNVLRENATTLSLMNRCCVSERLSERRFAKVCAAMNLISVLIKFGLIIFALLSFA